MHLHLRSGQQLAYVVGSASRHAVLRARTGGYADAVAFVNDHLPQDSRVLFEARGYHFRVPVLQDNALVNWPVLAVRAVPPDCLRSTGITHVLVNESALQYYAQRGLDPDALRWDAFGAFSEACLVPIYAGGGFALYAVSDRVR